MLTARLDRLQPRLELDELVIQHPRELHREEPFGMNGELATDSGIGLARDHGEMVLEFMGACKLERFVFEEAAVAMTDPMAVDFEDSKYPDRLITVAISPLDRILYVVTTESGARTRIISARRATSHERRIYEEGD